MLGGTLSSWHYRASESVGGLNYHQPPHSLSAIALRTSSDDSAALAVSSEFKHVMATASV